MAAETVECNQCRGAAIVKAELPVAEPTEKNNPAEARVMIYCARCGMRSQPAAQSARGNADD
jgi:hypothetical protein